MTDAERSRAAGQSAAAGRRRLRVQGQPMPLTSVMMADSTRNWRLMSMAVAPSALRTPISRVRSVTATSMMFMTPMPPRASVRSATAPKKSVMTLKMRSVNFEPSSVSQIHSASLSSGIVVMALRDDSLDLGECFFVQVGRYRLDDDVVDISAKDRRAVRWAGSHVPWLSTL